MKSSIGNYLVLTVAFFLSAALGQTASSSAAEKPAEEQKPVQITLYPAPEPEPALKYQLLPPLTERRPGNAAVWWNRLPASRSSFFNDFYAENGLWEKIDKWMEIPIGDPREKEYRVKELSDGIGALSDLFADMDRAARFESCDWQLPLHEGDIFTMLLPEVQQSRTYARMLRAKTHLEIAKGNYDQAVRTLQTGYAQARHVAQGPTLVNSLVGAAIAGIMSHQVQQLIQQPDAPNLYWALSTLPRPLVDFRPGCEVEYSCLYLAFPELQKLDKKKLSPEEANLLLTKVTSLLECGGVFGDKVQKPSKQEIAEKIYPRAKRFLIEKGRSAAEVEAMPMAQVVLIASMQFYDQWRDECFKWVYLPMIEAGKNPQQVIKNLKETSRTQEFLPLASMLLPSVQYLKNAETRIQWNLAKLRIFEAMRLYAANHEGRWPDRLSDIKEVPIPVNPFNGKPFLYQRDGEKAVLSSETGHPRMLWRYEITLGRKGK